MGEKKNLQQTNKKRENVKKKKIIMSAVRRRGSLSGIQDDYHLQSDPTEGDDQPLIDKDPYLQQEPELGCFECKLCLTHHRTEEEYLQHRESERHQRNHHRKVDSEKMDMPVSANVMATLMKLGGALV